MSVAPPPRLLHALQRIGEAINDRDCPWAVAGGLTVSIRVEPRFTRDVDVVVAVADDDAAEALVADLQQRGFTIQLLLEQAALGRLATVRHLVAMKALSVSSSRQRALDAATRIEAVGANRGRALRADLERRLPAP